MKKLPMLVSLLFLFLMVLIGPIVAAAISPPKVEPCHDYGWLAFAILCGLILFVWVAYKANGKVKRWLEKKRP